MEARDAAKHLTLFRAPTTQSIILSKCQQCKVKKPCIRLRFLKTHLSYSALYPQHLSTKGGSQHPFTTYVLLRHQQALSGAYCTGLNVSSTHVSLTPLPAASVFEGVTFLLSRLSVISLCWNLHMHGAAFAFLRRGGNKKVDFFSSLAPSILMDSDELQWKLVLVTVAIRFIISTLYYWVYVWGMEGKCQHNERLWI